MIFRHVIVYNEYHFAILSILHSFRSSVSQGNGQRQRHDGQCQAGGQGRRSQSKQCLVSQRILLKSNSTK